MPWLRHFALLVVFVATLFRPAAAGAFASAPDANAQARVGAFELVAATLVGPASVATCGLHEGIGAAYDENASGYRFAAGGGGEMVSLYRAVGDAELGVIRSTGRIPESLSGLAVKYLSATPEGAASHARQAVRGFGDAPYTLVETQVPRSALPADVLLQVDRNVPAVVLPNTHLPLLGPAHVWSFMPVP
jgi:hypothetical protein